MTFSGPKETVVPHRQGGAVGVLDALRPPQPVRPERHVHRAPRVVLVPFAGALRQLAGPPAPLEAGMILQVPFEIDAVSLRVPQRLPICDEPDVAVPVLLPHLHGLARIAALLVRLDVLIRLHEHPSVGKRPRRVVFKVVDNHRVPLIRGRPLCVPGLRGGEGNPQSQPPDTQSQSTDRLAKKR